MSGECFGGGEGRGLGGGGGGVDGGDGDGGSGVDDRGFTTVTSFLFYLGYIAL